MQLGFENKKQTMWAAALGVVALLALAYEVIPFFTGSSTQASSAEIAAPVAAVRTPSSRSGTKNGKKVRAENLGEMNHSHSAAMPAKIASGSQKFKTSQGVL